VTLRARLAKLEARSPARDPGRLFFLLPDLWPENDRAAFDALSGEALADLVERRTGVRPVLGTGRIWAIITHVPEECRAMSDAEKEAFLDEHETRPLAPWQRREAP
jgi:hypothetical protein